MARAGYYAGVTLIDSYIGLVLNKLDELGVADSTIVIHTSDHGYLLGEHAEWAKQTLYDTALRVPLMIRTPGTRIHPISHMESFQGVLTGADSDLVQPPLPPPRTKRIAHGIVELNDLYPTLAELAGLPAALVALAWRDSWSLESHCVNARARLLGLFSSEAAC